MLGDLNLVLVSLNQSFQSLVAPLSVELLVMEMTEILSERLLV